MVEAGPSGSDRHSPSNDSLGTHRARQSCAAIAVVPQSRALGVGMPAIIWDVRASRLEKRREIRGAWVGFIRTEPDRRSAGRDALGAAELRDDFRAALDAERHEFFGEVLARMQTAAQKALHGVIDDDGAAGEKVRDPRRERVRPRPARSRHSRDRWGDRPRRTSLRRAVRALRPFFLRLSVII